MSFFWIGIILFACGALLAYMQNRHCQTTERQQNIQIRHRLRLHTGFYGFGIRHRLTVHQRLKDNSSFGILTPLFLDSGAHRPMFGSGLVNTVAEVRDVRVEMSHICDETATWRLRCGFIYLGKVPEINCF